MSLSSIIFKDPDEDLPLNERGEIYLAENLITGKCYVGQTRTLKVNGSGTQARWTKHVSEALRERKGCVYLENAIRKYGKDAWRVIILEYCPLSRMDEREVHYIAFYKTMAPTGYNLTTGGSGRLGGPWHSEETKRKMSEKRLANPHYARKVEIDGIVYDTVKRAAEAHEVTSGAIAYRIKHPDRFPGYRYID